MQPTQQPPEEWSQPTSNPVVPPVSPSPQVAEPISQAASQPQEVPEPPQPESAVVPQQPSPLEVIDESAAPIVEDEELASGVDTPSELPADDAALLRWEATEYLHHTRGVRWYVIFVLVAIVAIVLAIVVVKSITFAILIPVMAAALLVYVRHAPELLQYTLSRKGLHVNDKLYGYDTFKAFGIISHNDSHSVVLIPRKRFQISQTLYFPEEIGEQLVDMLAARLPMEEISPDAVDRLLTKLHL